MKVSKSAKLRRRRKGGVLGSPWLREAILGPKIANWLATGMLTVGLAVAARANPTGPQVRAGQVNITPGQLTQIQQLTDKAIVDWRSFSISAGETVRILQPNQLSVILNRVVGVDPSTILGRLEANGNVFLINPNGILFGPGSVVNVGGLMASTLNITNEDFLAGRYVFEQDASKELASVVNRGTIEVTEGGYAVLLAPGVVNEGTIIAKAGNVLLAAGERSTLNLDGRNLVHYTLSNRVTDGAVLLAPGMMSDALAATLGVPEARRADQLVRLPDGSVRLEHGSGTLVQSGILRADGSAGVDAGSVTLDSSDLTLVEKGSVSTANGVGLNSDGGEVVILSEMNGNPHDRGNTVLRDGASIAARGGVTGDGGFVETSGDRMTLRSTPDLRAPGGRPGHYLIDPDDVRIVDGADPGSTNVDGEFEIGAQHIESFLETTGNMTIASDTDLRSEMVNDTVAPTSGFASLTLTAITDIDLGDDVYAINGDFNLTAGTPTSVGDIRFGDSTVDATGGTFTATGSVLFETSDVEFLSGVSVTAGALVDFGSSTFRVGDDTDVSTVTAGATLANIELGDAHLILDGLADFNAEGDILLETSEIDATSRVELRAERDVSFANMEFDSDTDLVLASGRDILLGNADLELHGDLLITAGRDLHTESADVNVGQANPAAAGPAEIKADVAGNITKSAGGYLAADRILLFRTLIAPTGGSIDVNINTDEMNAQPIRLAAYAAGDVFIRDVGTNPAGPALRLVRQDNPTGTGGTRGSITSDNGFIQVTTGRELFLGNITTPGPGDSGPPLVAILDPAAPAGRSIVLVGSSILDNNSGTGPQQIEISNPVGLVSLNATDGVGIGSASNRIDVSAVDLEAVAGGVGDGIFLRSDSTGLTTPRSLLGFTVNGGEVHYFEGNAVVEEVLTYSSGDLLSLPTAAPLAAETFLFRTVTGDLRVDNFLVGAGQLIELKAVAGSVVDNDNSTATPSLVANGVGSQVVLVGANGVGAGVPLTVLAPNGVDMAVLSTLGSVNVGVTGDLNLTTLAIPPSMGALGANFSGVVAQGTLAPNSGSVSLSATGDITATPDFALDPNDRVEVRADSGAVNVTAGDTLSLLDVRASNGGVTLSSVGNLNVADVTAGNGSASLTASAGALSAGDIVATDAATASSADINVSASGAIDLGGTVLADRNVSIASTAGAITSDAVIDAAEGSVALAAAGAIDVNAAVSAQTTLAISTTTGGMILDGALDSDAGDVFLNAPGTIDINQAVTGFLDVAAHSTGSGINLDNQITAGRVAMLEADGGAITHSANGRISGPSVALEASGDIGALGNELTIDAAALVLDAGGDAYLRDLTGDLSLQNNRNIDGQGDVTTGPVGGDLVLRTDSGALSIDTPLSVAGNLTLASGVTSSSPAANILLNENVTSSLADLTSSAAVRLADGVTLDTANALTINAAADLELGQSSTIDSGSLALEAGGVRVGPDGGISTVGDLAMTSQTAIEFGEDSEIQAGGDLLLDSGADLALGDAAVSAGNNAILRSGRDIHQRGGTLTAGELALSATRDLVSDGDDFLIDADKLALQVGGRAFLRQSSGDLELVGSVEAAGVTQSGGSVGEMRVRVDGGDLLVSAPYQANNMALVTGTSLVGAAGQSQSGDIVVQTDLGATSNLVLLSAGRIEQTGGTLSAPNIGLGASGAIGSAEAPIQLQAENISINQQEPFLESTDGLSTVPQVTASGVTVNNAFALPEPPVPPEPPTPPTPGRPTSPPETVSSLDPGGRLPEALSPDRVDRVEQALDEVLYDDLPQGEPVLEWWDDEDLLRKKRRF